MKALATAALLGLAFTYEDNEYFKSDKLHLPIRKPIHPKNHTNHTIRPIRPIHPIHHPIKPIKPFHPRNHTLRPITRPIYTAIPDVHVPTHRPPHVPRGVLVKDHTKKTVENDDEFFAFDENEFMALAEDEFFTFDDDELFSFFRRKNNTLSHGRKNATQPHHGRKNRTEKPKSLPFYKRLLQNDDDEFFAFDENEFMALAEDEFFTFDDDELFSFFRRKNNTLSHGRKNATQPHHGRKNRTEKPKSLPFYKRLLQNDDDEFFAFEEDEFLALAEDEFFAFDDDELFSFFKKKNATQPHKGRKNRTERAKPVHVPKPKKVVENDDDEFFAFDEDEFFAFDDDELFSFFRRKNNTQSHGRKNATQPHHGRKNRTEKPKSLPFYKRLLQNDDDEFFAFDDDELFSFFKRKNATQRQGRKNATHPHHGRKNMTQLHYGRKNQTDRVKPVHVPHPKKLVQKDDDEFFAFDEDEFFAFDEDEFFAFDDDELFSFFKKKNGTQPHKGRKNRTERAKPIHVPKPKKVVENDDDEFFAFDEDEFFAFDDDELFSFFNRRNGTRNHGRKNHTEHPRFHPLRKTIQNDDDEFFIFANKKNHTRKERDPRKHVPLHKIPHFNLTAIKNRPRIPARPRNVVENDDDEFFAFEDDLELFDMEDHFADNELKSKFLKGVGNFFKKHGPTLINIGTKLIGLDDDELFVEGLTDHELGIIKNIGDLIKKKVGFDDFADDSLVHLGNFIKDGLKVTKEAKTKNYHDLLKTIRAPGKGK